MLQSRLIIHVRIELRFRRFVERFNYKRVSESKVE